MVVPQYHEFMKPLFELLAEAQKNKVQSMYADSAQHFQLTEADKTEYLPSGKQLLYHNRNGWAKTNQAKAELVC